MRTRLANDATTHLTIDANLLAAGSIIAREELVVAGLGAIPRFLRFTLASTKVPRRRLALKSSAIPKYSTACELIAGQVLAVIRHNARVLLSCERVILNLLQHMSGIATLTRKYRRRDSGHPRPGARHAQDRARHARS